MYRVYQILRITAIRDGVLVELLKIHSLPWFFAKIGLLNLRQIRHLGWVLILLLIKAVNIIFGKRVENIFFMHDAGLIYWSFHRIWPVKLIFSSPKPSHTVINLIVWLLHTLVIYIHIRHLIVSNWRALLWGLHLTILGIFAQINLIITRSHILDGSEALV